MDLNLKVNSFYNLYGINLSVILLFNNIGLPRQPNKSSKILNSVIVQNEFDEKLHTVLLMGIDKTDAHIRYLKLSFHNYLIYQMGVHFLFNHQ